MAVQVEEPSAVQDSCQPVCLSLGAKMLRATHLLDLKMKRDASWMWPAEGDAGVDVVIPFQRGCRLTSAWNVRCWESWPRRKRKRQTGWSCYTSTVKEKKDGSPSCPLTNWNLSFIPVLTDEWGSCWQNEKSLLHGSDTFRSQIFGPFIFFILAAH